jgi:creatinine amidohydrolase
MRCAQRAASSVGGAVDVAFDPARDDLAVGVVPARRARCSGGDQQRKQVVADAARSLARHGFSDIVILGDSGNYQAALKAVADALNRDWRRQHAKARAHFIAEYYLAAQAPFHARLRERGLSDAQIGTHAGAADTALMLAVDASKVWPQKAAANADGVSGDPSRASAELGRLGTDLIVQRSVAAIRHAVAAPR